MATIIETYEANTRMMKQNSEMLQEILRQVKSLAAHLDIVDEGEINDVGEVMAEQDNPNSKSHQVFDKLSTPTHPKIDAENCDEEFGDEQVQLIQDIVGVYPHKEKATVHYQFEQRPPFLVTIHKPMAEPWKPLVITEVVEIAIGVGPRTIPTYFVSNSASTDYLDKWLKKLFNETQVVKVDDLVLFRLLVMERMVDLCQKFHQVLDRLPMTIDTEVHKQPIESSDDPSVFRLLVMERMVDLCDRNLKIKVTKITGDLDKMVALQRLLEPYGICERQATKHKNTSLLDGLHIICIINESMIVAVVYDLDKKATEVDKKNVVIFDRGDDVIYVYFLLIEESVLKLRCCWEHSSWNLEDKVLLEAGVMGFDNLLELDDKGDVSTRDNGSGLGRFSRLIQISAERLADKTNLNFIEESITKNNFSLYYNRANLRLVEDLEHIGCNEN
ncbi:hypothetical protein GQ457_01G018230 [Hibiscus cannabinus]